MIFPGRIGRLQHRSQALPNFRSVAYSMCVESLGMRQGRLHSYISSVPIYNRKFGSCPGWFSVESNCDHNAITIGVNLLSRITKNNHLTKTIWMYAKADITHGKNLLRSLPVASDSDCVDDFWSRWSKHFLSAMRECIPSKTVPIRSYTPWIDRDISHDIRRRERWYHKFKVSKSAEWLAKYKALRNAIVCKIRKAKQAYFNNLANSRSDSKKFWSSIRLLRPRSIPSSSSLSHGSTVAHTDQDKAELLNTYFASCFNTVSVPPTLYLPDTTCLLRAWTLPIEKFRTYFSELNNTQPLVQTASLPGC